MPLLQNLSIKHPGLCPEWLKPIYLRMREIGAGARALPDFVIIGAQKAGSTSLFNYLCQHPQIYGSMPKEIFYFNREFDRGENWYRRHFPKQDFLRRRQAISGEASTMYLYSEQAPRRLAAMLPNIKIIAILREPAARAVSHYNHRVQTGVENRAIEEVFSSKNIDAWRDRGELSGQDREYFERGYYARHLKRWVEIFPRESIHVQMSEAMFQDTQNSVCRVCEFLRVGSFEISDQRAFKSAGEKRKTLERIKELQNSYHSYNKELLDLGLQPQWAESQKPC